jgi:hypothetical protein
MFLCIFDIFYKSITIILYFFAVCANDPEQRGDREQEASDDLPEGEGGTGGHHGHPKQR